MSNIPTNDEINKFISNETNAGGRGMFDLSNNESYQIKIRRDDKVAPAMFLPDPIIPGGYKANQLTIRAMRKDIFVTGNEENLLDMIYPCLKCNNNYDLQFWIICPYCGVAPSPSFERKTAK